MSTNSITPACNPRFAKLNSIQRSPQLKSDHRAIALNTQVKSQIHKSPFNFSFICNTGFQFLIQKCALTFDAFTAGLLNYQRLFEKVIRYIRLHIIKPILIRPASDNRSSPTKQRHSGFEYSFDSQSAVDELR